MANLLDGMDKVYSKLVPELGGADVPTEPKTTCFDCAMAPKPGADPNGPVRFTAKAHCCTYQPALANHVVGRILRRGDRGTETMRARIEQGGGLSIFGVGPSPEWNKRYNSEAADLFGRADDLTCPYWVGAPNACSIWRDRNSTCRTWFCKHESAGRGHRMWLDARDAIGAIDKAVALYCVTLGTPPGENATAGEWMAWYRWCAERVDLFDAYDLERVRRPELLAGVTKLIGSLAPGAPLPDVVVPSLLMWFKVDDAVLATSYSAYDLDELPPALFGFLSRLDAVRTWREALGDEAGVDEALVRRLWDRGLLSTPEGAFVAGSVAVTFPHGDWSEDAETQKGIAESLTDAFRSET